MTSSAISVRPLASADRAAWLELWAAYCAFYHATIPLPVTEATWQRVTAATGPMRAIVAADAASGEIVGFAQYVVHPYTWSAQPACYLEDLFVRPSQRRGGVGRALIEHLVALAKHESWSRLYWMTQADNESARRLYDRIGNSDDFVRYVIEIEGRDG